MLPLFIDSVVKPDTRFNRRLNAYSLPVYAVYHQLWLQPFEVLH